MEEAPTLAHSAMLLAINGIYEIIYLLAFKFVTKEFSYFLILGFLRQIIYRLNMLIRIIVNTCLPTNNIIHYFKLSSEKKLCTQDAITNLCCAHG